MELKHSWISNDAFERLDLCLQDHFPDHSRSSLQKLIRENRVLLRGVTCSPKSSVAAGDSIEVEFPPSIPSHLEPEDFPIEVLFEDKHLLVLNKSAGIVVHPGAGHSTHTLVHALLHHCQGQLSGVGGIERPGIVHRLDKDTSGCLIVAKSDTAHRLLVDTFQNRSIEKIYLALVWGKPRTLSGRVNQPIGRHHNVRTKMEITDSGREAITDWKVREEIGPLSLLECRIHTGRTHQIRVHLSSLGHPIAGDLVYGRSRKIDSLDAIPRQMLHAWKLTFDHPFTKKKITCEAPLPHDLIQVMASAKKIKKLE